MAKHVQTARGNLGPLDRNVVEFDYHIEQRPGRLRYNADDVLRSACKQCVGKVAETPWVDESERADELTEPLGLRGITWAPEVTNDDMRRDVLTWYRQCTHCARGRWPPNKSHGKLQKVIVGEPLDIVAVDILSGLPTIPEGYR